MNEIYVDARPGHLHRPNLIAVFSPDLMICQVLKSDISNNVNRSGRISDQVEEDAIKAGKKLFPLAIIYSDSASAAKKQSVFWIERQNVGIRVCDRCLKKSKDAGAFKIKWTGKKQPEFISEKIK